MSLKLATVSTLVLVAIVSACLISTGQAASSPDLSPNSPVTFTENAGQWDESVFFRASTGNAVMWFVKDGAYYQFVRALPEDTSPGNSPNRESVSAEFLMIRTTIVGANTGSQVIAEEEIDYKCNFFLGNDQSRWRTDVPNYSSVRYSNIYNGIDVRYYGAGNNMEYDYIIHPGYDPSTIEILYEGVESLSINADGELEITTAWGTVTETCPYIYQIDGDDQIELEGSYLLASPNTVGFVLTDSYNPALPIVIDPVLIYSTYLGGWAGDYGWGVEVDSLGDMYLSGQTTSSDFPVVAALNESNAGNTDVFITKMRMDGSLVFSTYYGGWGQEEYPRMALDDECCMYISGRTYSDDIPIQGGYSSSLNGNSDLFAVKVNAEGNALVFSTYLGGSKDDYAGDLAVDPNHNLYISSTTESIDFPTVNPFMLCPYVAPGSQYVTVSKLSVLGDALEYSTYLGGLENEVAMGMTVDDAGCAYVNGYTFSPGFPLENAYDSVLSGCDAFVSKFSPEGNSLVFSTFLGGTENEWAESMDIDDEGNVYLAGNTRSLDFPLVNPVQDEFHAGGAINVDNFISKFDPTGSVLLYSTYLGGYDDDFVERIKVDNRGIAYITGSTYSFDYPLAVPLFNEMLVSPDIFISAISADGGVLVFSTFLGGNDSECGYDIAFDEDRRLHLTGYTRSSDYPTVDPFQATLKATYDAVVSVIEMGCCIHYTGNADYDITDNVDIVDCMYMIQWLYATGPPPMCYEEADMNGDGSSDLADAVFLIDYMFHGGTVPAICPTE